MPFKNEIVWRRNNSNSPNTSKRYTILHDTIYFYTKSSNYMFTKQFNPWSEQEIELNKKTCKNDNDGKGYYWWCPVRDCSKERMKELEAKGELKKLDKWKHVYRKFYLTESRGKAVGDIWTDVTGKG